MSEAARRVAGGGSTAGPSGLIRAVARRRREVPLVPAASIAGRALVTVIAIMTFLASLAAGAAVLVEGTSHEWQDTVSREATVQIRPVPGRDIEADVAKAVLIIKAAPGVATVEAFDKGRAEKLLEPWLGASAGVDLDLGDLPIPRLIVVRLASGTQFDAAALKTSLDAALPNAILDDHRAWRGRLATMTNTLAGLAGLVLILVLTALGLAVTFATRGVMAGNREIIGVLHFVGAEDRFIAREFQRHFLRLGLQGAGMGGGLACLAFLLGNLITARLAGGSGADEVQALFGTFALGPRGYGAIVIIALGTALATGWMSRTIVFRHLRRLE
jgi:cell division transport system permease protein